MTLNLSNPDRKKLTGTVRVELLGAKGQSLARAEREVSQSEPIDAYRFELPAPSTPADTLTLRGQVGF